MSRRTLPVLLALALALASPARADGLREVPVDLSLVPPIALNGDGPALNHLSLGLAVARSTVLRGVALAPVHVADEDVTGIQVTWAAGTAGGTVRGVQLTTVTNVAGALRGVQLAHGVNVARGEAQGLQLGAAVNWAGRLEGLQLGWAVNRAAALSGVQAAPINVARRLDGLQVAVVNVGGDVEGAQVGVVNVARRVRGVQLGVVNVADEADGALGVLSVVRSGRHDLEVYGTEVSPLSIALRLGGRRVHGLVTAGVKPGASGLDGVTRWTAGGGAGIGFAPAGRLTLDVDALALRVHDGARAADAGIATLRFLCGWRSSEWIALFGGPTVNLLLGDETRPDLRLGWTIPARSRDVRVWAGFVAGLRL